MDRTDLQELIEVIAERLRHSGAGSASSDAAGGTTAGIAIPMPATSGSARDDAARLVAELVATAPKVTDQTPAPVASIRTTSPEEKDEDGNPLGRMARSLITGLGVTSFIKGLFDSDDPSPAKLPKLPPFELPTAVRQEVAYSSRTGEYLALDRSESGALRMRDGTAPGPITINVQAMDSKSFMDHSGDIARAVREAILNSHALNDVVSEL